LDPALKNLREWVALLFILFLVLDIAGVQYGLHLARSSPVEPDPTLGEIAALIQGQRGAYHNVYVTPGQRLAYYGLLGAAGLSLLATLTVIVAHGIRQLRPERTAASKRDRRRR
jgi:hypothetical protein